MLSAGSGQLVPHWGRRFSEPEDVSDRPNDRIDLCCANVLTIKLDVGFDVDVADIETHGSGVVELVIDTSLQRVAPGIVEFEFAEVGVFFKESRVVDAGTDLGLPRTVGR